MLFLTLGILVAFEKGCSKRNIIIKMRIVGNIMVKYLKKKNFCIKK